MTYSQVPRLASVLEVPRALTGVDVLPGWPPPGTVELPIATPGRWVVVQGVPTAGDAGTWFLTDLAHVATATNSTVDSLLISLGQVFTGPIVPLVGAAGHWPVIYEVPEVSRMRWIKSTIRGTLGGVEQFQFGINWGNPGADPDPNEAETLAFAVSLAAKFATALANVQSTTASAKSLMSADVVFTEVGAVVLEQSTATDSHGGGSDMAQKFDTQWTAFSPTVPGTAAGGACLPYETSCALTLETDTRGPRGRGRIYWPPMNTNNMSGQGKYSLNAIKTLAECLGDYFDAVTAAHSYKPLVVSRRANQLHAIKRISVGYVPDSQRRRRRAQDEARSVYWTTP